MEATKSESEHLPGWHDVKCHNALEFYDAVMSIRNFQDAYNGGPGWSLRHQPGFDAQEPISAVRVGALGDVNSGKTWLLGRLFGVCLPSSTEVHTEGISVKVAALASRSYLLFDTVGFNAPIAMQKGIKGPVSPIEVASILDDLQVQEAFYRMLTFNIAQVIILVLGQMTHKAQSDIVSLARDIHKCKEQKQIIVVHNLREWSRAQLLAPGADGRNYLQRNLDIFGFYDVSVDEQLATGKRDRVDRHRGFFGDVARSYPMDVIHYYLTNDTLPCSLNEFALQNIGHIITNTLMNNKALGQELAAAASAVQTCFVSFAGPEPVIKFDAEAEPKCFVAAPDGKAQVKTLRPGAYFLNGPEEVIYSVAAVPCEFEGVDEEDTDSDKGDEDERTKMLMRREAYLVQIELPGLSDESFRSIKQSLAKRALRSEVPRAGAEKKVVLVDFEAQLLNVPLGFFQAARETSKHKYTIPSNPAEHKTVERGTRPAFPDGVRTVKVTIWTDIEDRDSKYHPFVTYLDGILSITFVRGRH